MSVRAKFTLQSYETSLGVSGYEKKPNGEPDYSRAIVCEVRTLKFSPVSDGSPENKRFFNATPSGRLELGIVNQEAWKHFELNKSYYLDFTPAE